MEVFKNGWLQANPLTDLCVRFPPILCRDGTRNYDIPCQFDDMKRENADTERENGATEHEIRYS